MITGVPVFEICRQACVNEQWRMTALTTTVDPGLNTTVVMVPSHRCWALPLSMRLIEGYLITRALKDVRGLPSEYFYCTYSSDAVSIEEAA